MFGMNTQKQENVQENNKNELINKEKMEEQGTAKGQDVKQN